MASSCVEDGDTAWVNTATLLVLGMIPALGLFEAGLLPAKNTSSIISQVFGGTVLLALMWDLIGFSLTFGDSIAGVIGNPTTYPLMLNLSGDECFPFAPTIPKAAFASFQQRFACISPLLMTGAYAERTRWHGFLVFTVSWEVLVYYPVAHWVWSADGWLRQMGVLDFAGGIVIHTTAGVSAFIVCWYLGKRLRPGHCRPSNMPMASLGAALLWLGWFGFNAGSAMGSGSVSVSTIATTQAGAVACGTVWVLFAQFKHRDVRSSIHLEDILNGIIGGLAGITPASGYIAPQWGLVSGAMLGVLSLLACRVLDATGVDDALEVTAVHGVTGLLGSLFVGLFASLEVNPAGADGLIAGGGFRLLGLQALGIVVCGSYAGMITIVLAFVVDKTIGFRVSPYEEELGLDAVEHAVKAYEWLEEGDGAHLLLNRH